MHLLVITRGESELLSLIKLMPLTLTVADPNYVTASQLAACDSIAILGGEQDRYLSFSPSVRDLIEHEVEAGKKVFSEYCLGIGHVRCDYGSSTRYHRLMYTGCETDLPLDAGDLLEDQCNTRLRPGALTPTRGKPILQYTRVNAHLRIDDVDAHLCDPGDRGLWFETQPNLLVCCFRLCNFNVARFSPRKRWIALVEWILKWLTGVSFDINEHLTPPYVFYTYDEEQPLEEQVKAAAARAIDWYEHSGSLPEEGIGGVFEGFATEINPLGEQRRLTNIRADCSGETAMAYCMHNLFTGSPRSRRICDNLFKLCFGPLQCKEPGLLHGMVRWSEEGYHVCFQDDVARVLYAKLLDCLYSRNEAHLQDVVDALWFLVRTTGTDGLRVIYTDNVDLTAEKVHEMASQPANMISTHFNANMSGALLLAYKMTGIEEFKVVGEKGLTTLMEHYPVYRSEYSDTQELSQLILPLTYLYWATGNDEHKHWLYRVCDDMRFYEKKPGYYIEWDEGYRAERYNAGEGDESTLLTKNGDPVIDVLYTVNWLPMSFAQAYFVTKDERFLKDFWDVAAFFVNTQMHSSNPILEGAWARAYEMELREVYSLPADIGWGPWAIETGWTMGPVITGLYMGLMSDRLKGYYE